ncbi:MAG: folate family ECF transporter S component [Massilimicrobiota timonensis]
MEQVVIAMIIIALGFYVFKFYPFEKGNVMKLVIAAIFIILTAICKRLAIMIPLFGTESLKIGFEYIPLMLAGYFLSPSYAFLVGLCSDVIGLIIVPTGFPFFGFTLGTILVSIIPSMVHVHFKRVSPTKVLMIVIGLIVILGVGASLYISQLDVVSISDTAYSLKLQDKITLISLCLLLSLLFVVIILFLKRKINTQEAKTFSTWILCVVLTEIVVTLCLTPLWLDMMYHIPWTISLCIRVVKECAILPIEIFIGYSLIPFLRRIWVHLEK